MGDFSVNEAFIKIIMATSQDWFFSHRTNVSCTYILLRSVRSLIMNGTLYLIAEYLVGGCCSSYSACCTSGSQLHQQYCAMRVRAHTHIYMYRLPLARWRALASDARWNVTDALRVIARRFSQSALNWPINTPPRSYDFIQSERAWSRNVRPY